MNQLDKILGSDEKVLWKGKPKFWPYIFSVTTQSLLIGLILAMFIVPLAVNFSSEFSKGLNLSSSPFNITIVPLALLIFWVLIGSPLYNILVYRYLYYAITTKRVIFQGGLIGRDFKSVDFDKITNAEVRVGLMDKVFGGSSGSILIATAGATVYGDKNNAPWPYTIYHIAKPYEIYKFFQKVSYDIKTDISYPNRLRPSDNPGYKTEYKP